MRKREREFSDVRANGGRISCNEIQPHWIHGAVSGVERPSLLKFLKFLGIIKEDNDRRSRFPTCTAIRAQSVSISRSTTLVARNANVGPEQTFGARHR